MCIVAAPAVAAAMAYASLAAGVVGAGVSAYGMIQQGQQQSAAAKAQAKVAKQNAQVQMWQAQDAIDRGKNEEQRQRTLTRLRIGEQTAALAGQGTEVGYGTPLDILGDTAAAGELDALTIRSNAEREAYGYKVGASNLSAEAAATRTAGRNAMINSWMSAGGNILGSASDVSNKWSAFKTQGVL
jgi:hypothetical protein